MAFTDILKPPQRTWDIPQKAPLEYWHDYTQTFKYKRLLGIQYQLNSELFYDLKKARTLPATRMHTLTSNFFTFMMHWCFLVTYRRAVWSLIPGS